MGWVPGWVTVGRMKVGESSLEVGPVGYVGGVGCCVIVENDGLG